MNLKITARPCISSTRSVVYHHDKVVYIINPVGIVYHQDAGGLYTVGEADCDDIPSLRLGYKNSRSNEREFYGAGDPT